MLSSGFTNAPVAKFLVIYAVVSSIGLAIFDVKHLANIQVQPHLWQYGQFWRILVWQVAGYANSTEALFAAILAYHLRVVERMWGSRKFASFIIVTLPYTTIIPPILLALLVRPLSLNNLNYLPSGPTAVMFALLAQFYATIPHTFKYRLSTSTSNNSDSTTAANTKPSLTILLSDKSTTYLIAAQLALSQFPATLLPSVVGWAVGLAWRADILPVARQWRIPAWLVGEKESARRRVLGTSSTGRGVNIGSGEDSERYEDLRRRLDAAAAAATTTANSTAVAGDSEQRQRRPLLDRLRGVF